MLAKGNVGEQELGSVFCVDCRFVAVAVLLVVHPPGTGKAPGSTGGGNESRRCKLSGRVFCETEPCLLEPSDVRPCSSFRGSPVFSRFRFIASAQFAKQ